MTEREFLEKLREALENSLDKRIVQENMDYYRSYIEEETGQGRSKEEVIDELGDPWVLAQSVINMAENRSGADDGYRNSNVHEDGWIGDLGRQRYSDTQIHTYMLNGWKRLLFLLGIIGIVLIVFAVIGGLLSLIMPVLLPVLAVVLLLRFIKRMR